MFRRILLGQPFLIVASYAFVSARGKTCIRLSVSDASQQAVMAETPIVASAPCPKSSSKHSLHLISLSPKDDSFSQPAEPLVRECWKWKDSVLGDGRDYFVPRPKSLKAFHSLFIGMEIVVYIDLFQPTNQYSLSKVTLVPHNDSEIAQSIEIALEQPGFKQSESSGRMMKSYTIEECVALSNCARFEVILALKEKNSQSADADDADQNISMIAQLAAQTSVAYQLWRQTQNYKTKSPSFLQMSGLSSWLDLPDAVDTSIEGTTVKISGDHSKSIARLSQRLVCMQEPKIISTHLSLIASGLAPRTNRPDREVVFRPYSSRDAHILLQLKRTSEVISSILGGCGRIKILLDGALSAGKAARNEKIVPDIKQLKVFGSDGTPPSSLANTVAEAAVRLAVNPSIDACLARLKAIDAAGQISLLRQHIFEFVTTLSNDLELKSELNKKANVLLHGPTVRLREGEISDAEMSTIMNGIEKELKANAMKHRSNQ